MYKFFDELFSIFLYNEYVFIYKFKQLGVLHMATYRFTAFEPTGESLFDEDWEFESDDAAKEQGAQKIEELGLSESTHRLVNNKGKLVLFHT